MGGVDFQESHTNLNCAPRTSQWVMHLFIVYKCTCRSKKIGSINESWELLFEKWIAVFLFWFGYFCVVILVDIFYAYVSVSVCWRPVIHSRDECINSYYDWNFNVNCLHPLVTHYEVDHVIITKRRDCLLGEYILAFMQCVHKNVGGCRRTWVVPEWKK